jgi:hypothetical protein
MRLWRALSCIFLVSLLLHRAAAAESITNSPLYLLTYDHGGVILAEQSFWMKWASCHGNAGETAACIRRLTKPNGCSSGSICQEFVRKRTPLQSFYIS